MEKKSYETDPSLVFGYFIQANVIWKVIIPLNFCFVMLEL